MYTALLRYDRWEIVIEEYYSTLFEPVWDLTVDLLYLL